MRINRPRRRAVTMVECALIYPVTLLLVLGLIVGAAGIFRYQELASLARRAARYASVHGSQYAHDTGNPAATPTDIYNNAIAPNAAAMDMSQLSYSVTWNTDNYMYHANIVGNNLTIIGNTVTVTLTYQWIPEAFLGGLTLTSTSVMPMSY